MKRNLEVQPRRRFVRRFDNRSVRERIHLGVIGVLISKYFGPALLAVLAGCVVGPDYHQPNERMPDQFHAIASTMPAEFGRTSAKSTGVEEQVRWWKSLHDPILDVLVEQALSSNLDLAIAITRVEEARAESGVVAAGLWPMVGIGSHFPDYRRASANIERAHMESRPRGSVQLRQSVDKNGLSGPPSLYLTTPGHHPTNFLVTPGDQGVTTNVRLPIVSPNPQEQFVGRDEFIYQAGFDVAWELDVFGGVHREIEAAGAQVQAETETKNDVMVVLLADLARTYVELRGLQERLSIARRNIDSQQKSVELVQTRFKNGLTSDLDVALAERQLQTTQSRVPALESGIAEAKNRLALLLDQPLEIVAAKLVTNPMLIAPPPMVPTGLPSELLRNRPDIRRAERELAAATAKIGVATAELYPKFSLTGSFGMQSSQIQRILDADSLVWSAGPSLHWPIFDAGRIIGNIQIRELRAQEALLNYRRVLLTAIKEVDDALAGYTAQRERYTKLQQAVDSSTRAVRIAAQRYERGLTDFLNLLDAQRALYDLEDQAATSGADALVQLISLYKALGHGWERAVDGSVTMVTLGNNHES